jgi:hypothetical protein
MKLRNMVLALLSGAFFIGCTPTPDTTLSTATIKKNILGTWHSKSVHRTRDAVRIKSRATDTFYRNGTLVSTEYLSYVDRKGRVLGKMRYKRYFKWKVRGNTISTTFRSCTTRVLKRARNNKVEFVSDVLKIACKYANKLSSSKTTSKRIRYISRDKLIAGKRTLRR